MFKYVREKRIISFLLVAAMVFSFNVPAFAVEMGGASKGEAMVFGEGSEGAVDVEATLAEPRNERKEICRVYKHYSGNMEILKKYARKDADMKPHTVIGVIIEMII